MEEDYEPFQNPEDITSCNDLIPDIDESINLSYSDDTDDDDFHNDEFVEIISVANDENNPDQVPPTSLVLSKVMLTIATRQH